MLRRFGVLSALSTLGLLAIASAAWAHVEIEPTEAVAGSTATLTFAVEYEGSPTMGLEVQLPDGATVSDVPAKAGWTSTVDPAANTVSWTGGTATDDESFDLAVELPTTAGEVLFPAVVTTADGEVAWIEPEESEGEEGHPAPRITLTEDPNATTTTEGSTTTTTAATTTTDELPGTTLEAEERDDGSNDAAPWLIGSAIVALLAIIIGGLLLKRRADREKAEAAEAAEAAGTAPGATPGDGPSRAPGDVGPDGSGDGAGGDGSGS
jgi:uncharacterized protein YcnI